MPGSAKVWVNMKGNAEIGFLKGLFKRTLNDLAGAAVVVASMTTPNVLPPPPLRAKNRSWF